MDEYNSGMDADMKKFFKKIIASFSAVLIWMLVLATAGIFFKLGIPRHGLTWYNIAFYIFGVLSFVALARYLYRSWLRPAH